MPDTNGGAGRKSLDPEIQKEEAGQLRRIWEAAKVQRKFTQESAAHDLGWSTQGAVSQYLNGTIPLNLESAIKFARFLNCNIGDFSPRLYGLLSQTDHSADFGAPPVYKQNKSNHSVLLNEQTIGNLHTPLEPSAVPVVGDTQAGCAADWLSAGKPRDYGTHYVIHASTDSVSAYALRVAGNDLAPRYVEGDCLVLDPDATPEAGDEVLVKLNDSIQVRRLMSQRHGEIILVHPLTGGDHTFHDMRDLEYLHVIVSIATPAAIRKK